MFRQDLGLYFASDRTVDSLKVLLTCMGFFVCVNVKFKKKNGKWINILTHSSA